MVSRASMLGVKLPLSPHSPLPSTYPPSCLPSTPQCPRVGSPACSTGRKPALLSSKCNCSVCKWLKTSRSCCQCRSKHFCINSFRLFWKPLFLSPHVGVRTEMDGVAAGGNPTRPGSQEQGLALEPDLPHSTPPAVEQSSCLYLSQTHSCSFCYRDKHH